MVGYLGERDMILLKTTKKPFSKPNNPHSTERKPNSKERLESISQGLFHPNLYDFFFQMTCRCPEEKKKKVMMGDGSEKKRGPETENRISIT